MSMTTTTRAVMNDRFNGINPEGAKRPKGLVSRDRQDGIKNRYDSLTDGGSPIILRVRQQYTAL
jgi:hypothetical protein